VWQLSAGLSLALVLSAGAFKLYYDKSEAQKTALTTELQQSRNNTALLEQTLSNQNDQLEEQLQQQKESQQRINELVAKNNEAKKEVTELRGKFARHDLNMLSMAKPGLIERVVNRGTAKVLQELQDITNPNKFDENVSSSSDSNDS
jgi:DNA repair exonuclease SbcCD ATPase subunit